MASANNDEVDNAHAMKVDPWTLDQVEAMGIEEGSIQITGYWKYEFSMTATTRLGQRRLVVQCGGDRDDIYTFDPYGGWEEWHAVILRRVEIDDQAVVLPDPF
jgi:hypothetical protein